MAKKTGAYQGMSSMEALLGGDTYKGKYVPPLMAEVMKEMQAEERARAREAARPSTDQLVATKTAEKPGERLKLSASAAADLENIREAPDLRSALELTQRMPDLLAAAQRVGLAKIVSVEVEDREDKARQAASMLIIEGKSGHARHFGNDVWISAAPNGKKLALGLTVKQLFGYSDFHSNRFGIQTNTTTKRIRTGIGRFLPFSVGTDAVQNAMPKLSPSTLADSLEDFLTKPSA
jgi:hypothetical protein